MTRSRNKSEPKVQLHLAHAKTQFVLIFEKTREKGMGPNRLEKTTKTRVVDIAKECRTDSLPLTADKEESRHNQSRLVTGLNFTRQEVGDETRPSYGQRGPLPKKRRQDKARNDSKIKNVEIFEVLLPRKNSPIGSESKMVAKRLRNTVKQCLLQALK